MARTLDGEALADSIRNDVSETINRLVEEDVRPGLATIHMGTDPAAETYVSMKQRDCEELGIDGTHVDIPSDASEERLHEEIEALNDDPDVHGVLVQDDTPDHVDWSDALRRIDPKKDVDGLHPKNVGRLVAGDPRFIPCTPHGILQLFDAEGIDLEGADVTIVNRSSIVGKPLANLLAQKAGHGNATVTLCHSRTQDLAEKTRAADVLVTALGQPRFVDGSMVSEGTVVIDVGISRVDADTEKGYKLVGDVEFESVEPKADAITPVPGGVGPLTRVMLHYNTVSAAQRQAGIEAGPVS